MKLNLRTKIIIIFTSVMALSIIVFAITTNIILNKKYEDLAYSNLSQFVLSTENDWKNGNKPTQISGIAYACGNKSQQTYQISSNNNNICTSATIKNIVDDYKNVSTKGLNRREYKVNNVKLYVYANSDDSGNYIIAICTDSFNTSIKRATLTSIIIVFMLIIVIGDILLWFFTRSYANRIKKLGDEIILLPENNYEKEVNDYGSDEIGELGLNVERMRQSILEQEEIKKEMFQNLSHDLKTPIAVIKSYAEAIKDGIDDDIDVIIKQADILKEKANMMLELNKIEYLTEDDFIDINLKDVINDVISNYKHSNVSIITNIKDIYYKGILENYYEVIINLLDNATRYAKSKVIITLTEDEFSIYNDGDHISENILKDIFTPYVKGDKGEFGLGMAIVYKTLDIFNLDIKAYNIDSGVKFVIVKKG